MKKSKALSILLTLTLLGSIAIPGTLAGQANAAEDQDNGMVINKTASTNGDGTYTIQLEAYATGDKVITEVTEEVPTDIVLVLDQSGSMDESMSSYAFRAYTNRDNSAFYNLRHNGARNPNLYYPLNDGSYATVSVTVEEGGLTYTKITNGRNNSSGSWGASYTNYWNNRNNLYALVNGEYQKVTLTQETEGSGWDQTTYFVYKLPGGKTIARSQGWNGTPTFEDIDGGVLYLASADENQNVYTYTYTDADGTTQTIGTSTGANTEPDITLYQRYEDNSTSRLEALKSAVTNFANSVNEKAAGADGQLGTEDDVNHRIAVVGYASRDDSNNPWINTEVFIGADQYNYNTNASSYYDSAFQNMNTQLGQSNVTASIGALDANGATYTNYGLEMANGIFAAYPVPEGEKRNRVIVLFTDGYPGKNADDFNSAAASTALTQAATAKNSGVSLYAVGIFSGADPTTAGSSSGTNTEAANWFMQNVSSNNGLPQNPSYYLSASDAETLNNIFEQISDQIESGGSSTTLSEETVIRDIIAPAFTLPEGSGAGAITLETYSCTGKEGGEYTWEKNDTAMGAEVVIDSTDASDAVTTNNQVSVTGFDFAENYVGTVTDSSGTTYRGDKLVITFEVEPREGFFGGNGVYTNTSAGVYENSSADKPVMTFERPTVDVPLAEPVVDVPDANVYLGAYYKQSVPEDAVKMGATVNIGGYEIDFSKPNYGLKPWQNEYVNISIEAAAEGNGGSFENITEDITYTVTVTVAPKTPGSADNQTAADTGTGNIHVFKPQLTYQDSQAWYGDTVPEVGAANLTEETWIHHGDNKKHDDPDVQMLNDKPELSMTYTPDSSKITDGKVNTKQDIGVHVDVAMNGENIAEHTTFIHKNCDDKTCTLPDGAEFLLHVNTCRLTICKTGGAADEPYVFTVYKDGAEYTELTIVGNDNVTIYELPVGNYTIQEDTGWSWRYDANNGSAADLTAENPKGEITCTNGQNNKIYWLNGFSEVVENIFGNQH